MRGRRNRPSSGSLPNRRRSSGSVGSASLQSEAANAVAIPDTMDLRTAQVFQRSAAVKARLASRTIGSLAGGPVVLER